MSIVIEPLMMKDSADCCVACLAMVLGISYADALGAFPKRARVGTKGVTDRQLINASRRLGQPLRFVKNAPLDDVVGILELQRTTNEQGMPLTDAEADMHAVVVAKGTLYNPAEGLWWVDIEAFCKTRRWRPLGVWVKQEDRIG